MRPLLIVILLNIAITNQKFYQLCVNDVTDTKKKIRKYPGLFEEMGKHQIGPGGHKITGMWHDYKRNISLNDLGKETPFSISHSLFVAEYQSILLCQ